MACLERNPHGSPCPYGLAVVRLLRMREIHRSVVNLQEHVDRLHERVDSLQDGVVNL